MPIRAVDAIIFSNKKMRHQKNSNRCLLLVFILFFYFTGKAQNKFAVLLAVDDYYSAPGQKSSSSLQGCVNDAESIKRLLINRFGFDKKNISLLYNAAATKKNFFDEMKKTFQKCQPGDAVVFYYSGHGVWMSNGLLEDDSVKRGMSQAIVMNDLYAPGWDCLVSDESLKNIFNQFINNKIILTCLFDCCYSGNIPMAPPPPNFWTILPAEGVTTKQIEIFQIPYSPKLKKPVGCPAAANAKVSQIDADGDGVSDCRDWEINTMPGCHVDSLGVCNNPDVENFITSPVNQYSAADFKKDSLTTRQQESERAFNLRDAVTVSWRSSLRPSQRKNSRFLSISACSDVEKALEITDISEKKHGLFTTALLSVYKTNRSDISLQQLINKLRAVLTEQWYYILPYFHNDPVRLRGNLIGIGNDGFSDRIKTTVIANKTGVITIDKGLLDGITKGNIFKDAGPRSIYKITITNVSNETATAMDLSGSQVQPGDVLELTDHYTVSQPLCKIFIPSMSMTADSFQSVFKTKIAPFAKINPPGFDQQEVQVRSWDAAKGVHNIAVPFAYVDGSFCLLAMPSYIADNVRDRLSRDQNSEIVNDISKADLVVYFNYAGLDKNGKAEFEIFFHPSVFHGGFFVPANKIKLASIRPTAKEIEFLSTQLSRDLVKLLRVSTNKWLNTYRRQ
jgi:hypothetical protein